MFASDRSPLHTATISSNLKATSVLWRNEVSDKDIEKGTEKKIPVTPLTHGLGVK